MLPAVEIVTASEPELDVWLVQLDEQEVALVEDQVKVEVFSSKTDIGSADKFTVGKGVVGVGALPPPPPPPPPHEAKKSKLIVRYKKPFIRFNLKHIFYNVHHTNFFLIGISN